MYYTSQVKPVGPGDVRVTPRHMLRIQVPVTAEERLALETLHAETRVPLGEIVRRMALTGGLAVLATPAGARNKVQRARAWADPDGAP